MPSTYHFHKGDRSAEREAIADPTGMTVSKKDAMKKLKGAKNTKILQTVLTEFMKSR